MAHESRKLGWVYVVLFAVFGVLPVFATDGIYRVKADASSPTPDGLTWETAFQSIQSGVDATYDAGGGEVWVAAGTYMPSFGTVVTLQEGVAIYGGFAGTETARDQRDWTANVTTIHGMGFSQCVFGANHAILDGFTVTGGYNVGSGGGMLNQACSPVVANCIFTANQGFNGGGMYNNNGAAPVLTSCLFASNRADYGAGMYNNNAAAPVITQCVFQANTATLKGGGIYNGAASPMITNSSFGGNISEGKGGAIYSWQGAPRAEGCDFSGNTALGAGGAIYHESSSASRVSGCTFTNNSAVNGGALYNEYSDIGVTSCDFVGNTAEDSGGAMLNYFCSPALTQCGFDANVAQGYGGAIFNQEINMSSVQSCIFSGNTGKYGGGMANLYDASPSLTGCGFIANIAETGGGMYSFASGPSLSGCQFSGNAADTGGGMYQYQSALTLQSCAFDYNEAVENGGGIYNDDSDPVITNCIFSNNTAPKGAGIYCNGADAAPHLTECLFEKNRANGSGGGMSNNKAVPVLNRCIFVQNVAATDFGGGMYNISASPRIEGCVFSGNQAFRGGGMYNLVSSPQVTNSRFAGNRADSSGGGLEDNLATTSLTNSIFAGNTSGFGGALLIGGSSTSSLINCTVAGNAATFEGGGLYNSNSTPVFGNSIFWDNTAPVGASIHTPDATRPVITYSCVQGGYTGAGNLDADPLFAGVPPYGSLQLQVGSPCLDTGTSVGAPAEDYLERPRPQGTGVDMGAYEGSLDAGDIVTLTLAVRPEDGGITVPPADTYSFGIGEPVLLQAEETGLSFRYWDGDVTGWEAVQEITITEDLDITAVFGTNVIFVDEHSPAVYPDGSSWDRAYRDIQMAIDIAYALGESEVWVAAGSYTATTDAVVTLLEDVAVYGGFGGTEFERDQRDWTVNVTVIDGEGVRRCVSGADGAVLDGFTITHGWAGSGGGMVNWPASPTVANCLFTANTAMEKGGGMFNYDSSPQVIGCTFQGNTAGFGGGGIYNAGAVSVEQCMFSENTADTGGGIENAIGSVNITDCIFEANTVSFSGGGIYNADAAEPVVERCLFAQNVSEDFGGGIYNVAPSCSIEDCEFDGNSAFGGAGVSTVNASPLVSKCIFKNNQAAAGGGGIHIYGGSPEVTNCVFGGNTANMGGALAIVDAGEPHVMNCTLAGNTATEYAAALLVTNASLFITNSILWGNVAPIYQETLVLPPAVATVTFSCVAGGYAGTGNLKADPRFVDLAAGNLQLQAHSPCIDAGTDSSAPSEDIIAIFRPQNAGYDMGAYEFTGTPVPGLSVMPQELHVGSEAGTASFAIVTPAAWTVESDAAWITNPASGTGNGTLTVTFGENSGPARSALLTVVGAGTTPASLTVTVYQQGGDIPHPADLNEDFRIVLGEAIGYLAGWQQGSNPIAYAIRAAYLWQNGEQYAYDANGTPPLCWILQP
ncbi:MAG: putative outer membrane protein pmp6 precursor [Candidatus Hydrogenedentes bacterium ADurb.Bin179]|nr:MAG: putative outer membrane protein pmp6 precursor [Candidatus Hydrogenedentes bacterium ADurb.Bin179]